MHDSTDTFDSTEAATDREEVLSLLANTIRTVHDRVETREAEGLSDADAERLQIKWIRTLGYLSGQYRKLMKDTDIDEMQDDVDLLRAAIEED